MPPEKLFTNYTTLSITKKTEFKELAQSPEYNLTPGSVFSDGFKTYFFKDPLCFLFTEGTTDGRSNQDTYFQ